MRIAILGDTHFGEKGESPKFYDYYNRLLSYFFDVIDQENIKTVFHSGDLFHHRQTIDMRVWRWTQDNFLDPLYERGVEMYGIVGNHDIYFKSSSAINSPQEMLIPYNDLFYFMKEPEVYTFAGQKFAFLPWIHKQNFEESEQFLIDNQDPETIVLSHLELAGFEMQPGIYSENGQPLHQHLKPYKAVWSGHYHTRSQKMNIQYLGAPVEFNWNDYADAKGFYVYDTEKETLTFYQNPDQLFKKIYLTNDGVDVENYRNCIVRMIIDDNLSQTFVNDTIRQLNSTAWDVKVIDNTQNETTPDLSIEDSDQISTLDIIQETVNEIDTKLDKDRLFRTIRNIYTEAESLR